ISRSSAVRQRCMHGLRGGVVSVSSRCRRAPALAGQSCGRRSSFDILVFPATTIMSHKAFAEKDVSMPTLTSRNQLRELLRPGAAVLLPGVSNALAARVVADLGFPVAYVTGAGIANTFLGIPDNGLVTLSELAAHVAAIRDVFPRPLVVDADTAFGNPVNMVRTVKLLERAGADALQIEDQVFPKRCGHFSGKEVIPAAEMVAKVKAAVDARQDKDLLIIARTDAIAPEGYEPA